MRRILLLVLAILWHGKSKAQTPIDTVFSAFVKIDGEFIEGRKTLQAYEANSCLMELLNAVVNNDKECADNIGYYVSINNVDGSVLVSVGPVNLRRIRTADFYGYFVYRGRTFMCYGNTDNMVSKGIKGDALILRPYVSNIVFEDMYLGGDTNGKLKSFYCDGYKRYALIKTCKISSIGNK